MFNLNVEFLKLGIQFASLPNHSVIVHLEMLVMWEITRVHTFTNHKTLSSFIVDGIQISEQTRDCPKSIEDIKINNV